MARPHHGRFDAWLRGGQTVGHTFDMVIEVLLRLGLISLLLAIGVAFVVNTKASVPEQIAGWVTTEAWVCQTIGNPLPQKVSYTNTSGQTFISDVDKIAQTPAIATPAHAYWHRALGGFFLWLVLNYFLLFGAGFLFVFAGREKTKARQVRGQEVTRLSVLISEIEAFNRSEWFKRYPIENVVPRLMHIFSPDGLKRRLALDHHGDRLYSTITRDKPPQPAAMPYHAPRLAGVPYPFETELEHTLIVGAPGAGKSQAIHQLMESVRLKGERAIIFDPELDYIRHHYNEKTDVILNPFDARSPGWSPFNDAKDTPDWVKLGHAIFKDPKSGDPYWVNVARSIFSWTGYRLREANPDVTLTDALQLLFGPVKNLKTLLDGTPAGLHLVGLEGARVASLISVLTEGVEPLIYLHRETTEFSIRDWVNREDEKGGFLFLSAPESHMAALRPLLGFWSELAVSALLSRHDVRRHRTWFFLDEFHSAGRIEKLADGPQRLRKYGGAVVLGFQQVSQLTDLYGPDKAKTIIGQCQTKLILRAGDFETAQLMSDQLGRRVMRRVEENTSYGANSIRDGVGLVPKEELEPIVLPEDVQNFPKLQGMIRMSNARSHAPFPIAPIRIAYVHRDEIAPGYIPVADDPVREYLAFVQRRADEAKGAGAPPAGNFGGVGPRPERSNGTAKAAGPDGPAPTVTPGFKLALPEPGGTAKEGSGSPRFKSMYADVKPTAKGPGPAGTAPVTPGAGEADDAGDNGEVELANADDDGDIGDETDHNASRQMRPRAVDLPTEEAARRRRQEDEAEQIRQMATDRARREDGSVQRARTSVLRREGAILVEAETLGSLDRATQGEVNFAYDHRHQTFDDLIIVAVGAVTSANGPMVGEKESDADEPKGPGIDPLADPPWTESSIRKGALYDSVALSDIGAMRKMGMAAQTPGSLADREPDREKEIGDGR